MKKSYKIPGIVILVLIIFIALLVYLNRPPAAVVSGTLTISHAQQDIYIFTLEELKALPHLDIEKEIISSSSPSESGRWRGVALRDLLAVIDPNILAQAKQVDAYAEDAFAASYSLVEVLKSDSVMVVYAKDGVALATKREGGKGPLRIIVQDDHYGNRCLMYLWKIELR